MRILAAKNAILTGIFSLLLNQSVSAELLRMEAKQWGEQGEYSSGRYIWVSADMHGSIARKDGSEGFYRVPVTLIYADKAEGNVGLVDLINSASYQLMEAGLQPIPKNYVTAHGQKLLSDYLWRNGMSYIAVQWSKMVTDVRGAEYGLIENGEDGYQILEDAADFLRSPIVVEGGVPFQLAPIEHVLSFAFSQPSFLLWGMFKAGLNRKADGTLIFDGVLATVGGLSRQCRLLNNNSALRNFLYTPVHPTYYHFAECPTGLPDDGKFIKLETETEVMSNAAHTRFEADNFRQYEIAGVSHVTPRLMNLGRIGLRDQNYASSDEIIRAVFHQLLEWVRDGVEPVGNRYIEGDMGGDGRYVVARDADGNARGGIRPPHMISKLEDGTEAGAPLGQYSGRRPSPGPLEQQPEGTSAFWYHLSMIGGQFTPFDADRLRELYPTVEVYRHRVGRAADRLLKQRFLLAEDHKRIVKSAHFWDNAGR